MQQPDKPDYNLFGGLSDHITTSASLAMIRNPLRSLLRMQSPRFSTATLLFVMSFLCVLLALMAAHLRAGRATRAVVDALEREGAAVLYDDRVTSWRDRLSSFAGVPVPRFVTLDGHPVNNAVIQNLQQLPHVLKLFAADTTLDERAASALLKLNSLTELYLERSSLDDSVIVAIGGLAMLQRLSLRGTAVDDNALSHLAGLQELRLLDLKSTNVRQFAFANSMQCRSLETLIVDYTDITDDALCDIGKFSKLRHLSLEGTCITDDAIRCIGALPGLEELNLRNTLVRLSRFLTSHKPCSHNGFTQLAFFAGSSVDPPSAIASRGVFRGIHKLALVATKVRRGTREFVLAELTFIVSCA